MATKKKPRAPLPATSRAVAEFTGIEMAMALQTDLPGPFPYLSRHILAHSELLDRPEWRKILLRIVAAHAADHPPPKEDIAFLVEQEMLFGRSLEQARSIVAEDINQPRKTVVKAHKRGRKP